MRFRFLLFTALVLVTRPAAGQVSIEVVAPAPAFDPQRSQHFFTPPAQPADVLRRLFSFDSNRDDRITGDELPDRMRDLVRLHDQNGDGVLGRDEVLKAMDRAMASIRASSVSPVGLKTVTLADVIRDLRLPEEKRDRALAITRDRLAWLINRKPKTNENILSRLRELLDDEEYENLAAAAARIRTTETIIVN